MHDAVDVEGGLAAAGRVPLRRWVARAGAQVDCPRCGFPVDLTGRDAWASGCGVSDPSSPLAWLDGHAATLLDRIRIDSR